MNKFKSYLAIICLSIMLCLSGCGGEQSEVPDNTDGQSTPMSTYQPDEGDDLIGQSPKPDENQNSIPDTEEQEEIPEAKEPETLSIVAVGDIMCHDSNLNSAFDKATGTYDFNGFFEYVKPYISEADLAIANLETVTAGEEAKYTSYPLFNTPDAIVEALSFAGFDVLSTANNHCLDRGRDGLIRTIQKINENNMIHVGTTVERGTRFVTTEVKGFKISVLAYTYGCNGNINKLNQDERTYMVNLIDEKLIQEDICQAREIGSDVVIVCMHWGNEYHREPSTYQTQLAGKLLEWGADIVLGSHPHVVQKSEVIEFNSANKYIVYSMGNFISNYRREDQGERINKIYTEDGVMVRINLEKSYTEDGESTVLSSVSHIPTWVDKYSANGKNVFRIVPIEDNILDEVYINDRNREKVQGSYQHTMELLKDFPAIEVQQ